MTRSFCESWILCGWLVLATFGGIAIASSFLLGDKAIAQQTQPKAGAAKRFKFIPGKISQTKPKRKKASPGARRQTRKLAIPKPETLLALVRLYLVALDQAIKAKDFRVLHAISGPGLQSKMTVNQLAAAFADLRERRVSLAAVVVKTPQITESPAMLPGNILNIVGYFPTKPQRIDFHMQFQPANRQWRLRGMKISAKPVKRAKPKTAEPAKKKTNKNKKKNSATKK